MCPQEGPAEACVTWPSPPGPAFHPPAPDPDASRGVLALTALPPAPAEPSALSSSPPPCPQPHWRSEAGTRGHCPPPGAWAAEIWTRSAGGVPCGLCFCCTICPRPCCSDSQCPLGCAHRRLCAVSPRARLCHRKLAGSAPLPRPVWKSARDLQPPPSASQADGTCARHSACPSACGRAAGAAAGRSLVSTEEMIVYRLLCPSLLTLVLSIYTHTCAHACARTCMNTHVHVQAHTYTLTLAQMRTCTRACARAQARTCIHVHMRVHACKCAHTRSTF